MIATEEDNALTGKKPAKMKRQEKRSGFGPLLLCVLVLVFAAGSHAETTLYVGKHFEVRDHDQPTKYVFNGSTRVARINGSLSTNTRIQRFRLRPGWNLLSLAVSATNASDQLQRPGVITTARVWNPQTGNYSVVPQVAPVGTILWVNATSNATIAFVGTYADPVNRQVSAGATYLASTGLEAWTPTFPPSVAAWSLNPQPSTLDSQPTWLARLTGDLSSVNELPHTFAPGQALYVVNPAPFELEAPDPALRIRYYHQDHLGSSSVMTDANGVLVEESAFYPFGIPRHKHRLRQIEEAYKFTQKERDRESGFHYFEARYLAGGLARFMTQDPKYANPDALTEADAAGFLANPQEMNMYAYARNNPLSHVDPTGLGILGVVAGPVGEALEDTADKLGIDSNKVVAQTTVNFVSGFSEGSYEGGFNSTAKILEQAGLVKVDRGSTEHWVGFGTGVASGFAAPMAAVSAFGRGAGAAGKTGTGAGAAVTGTEAGGTLASNAGSVAGRGAGNAARVEANTSARVGNMKTVGSSEANTLLQTPAGPRPITAADWHRMNPERARIMDRLEATKEIRARMDPGQAGDMLRKIFAGIE